EDDRHAGAQGAARVGAGIGAVPGHIATGGVVQSGQDLRQRGLTGPVLPYQRYDLPTADLYVHSRQGFGVAAGVAEPQPGGGDRLEFRGRYGTVFLVFTGG